MKEQPPHSTSASKGTTFLKTCLNGFNALCGIGILTMPYTLAQGGWITLVLLLVVAIITCYTALLLQRCMNSDSSIKTYPDIGWHAFGRKGRHMVSIFLYSEAYLASTGFLLSESDNLHKLFPNVGFKLGEHNIRGRRLSTVLAGLAILPTMWLKDLSMLSFISAGGNVAIVIIISSILWVGVVDGVGFSAKGELFRLGGIPTALSLYVFSYGGHEVFPTIYSSMKDKTRFSEVMFVSFGLTTLSYMIMAIIGYLMFGKNTLSQISLNLPTSKIGSKIAIYTTLAGPIAKYALIISPIPHAIENHLPNSWKIGSVCILLRTSLLISTVILGMIFPFFEYLMALVGAILNVAVSILIPCACYLKIFEAYKHWSFNLVIIVAIFFMGISIGFIGTYSSLREIVKQL